MQCTQHCNAHNAVHITLQCTQHCSAHNIIVHTTLQCTQCSAHNTTVHTLQCTQHYSAHNTPVHTTLQCTQHSSAHNAVHTMQCTQCSAHNTTVHTTLQCTQHYSAHNAVHNKLQCNSIKLPVSADTSHDPCPSFLRTILITTLNIFKRYKTVAGLLSRYSDLLRAGWCGDRIPVRASFFAPVQTDPVAHSSSYTMCIRSFPGVKWVGVDHSPHLSPRLKKELSRNSTTPINLRGLF